MSIRALVAALSLVAGTAAADQIELTREMQAASLHEGAVDMVVYYLDDGEQIDVFATYAPSREPFEPARIRMSMADGDSVRFGVPGERQVIYSFARSGATLSVAADPTQHNVTAARLD
jgi:hypothetical protein